MNLDWLTTPPTPTLKPQFYDVLAVYSSTGNVDVVSMHNVAEYLRDGTITHWMPFPDPPKVITVGEPVKHKASFVTDTPIVRAQFDGLLWLDFGGKHHLKDEQDWEAV